MANNFFNKTNRNVSADHTLPTYVYTVPLSKKTIVIELDVANRSTSSQTISVMIDDFTAKGTNKISTVPDLKIKISYNDEDKQLMIEDNGIGMSEENLINDLGTIAKSGTKNFLKTFVENKSHKEEMDCFVINGFIIR